MLFRRQMHLFHKIKRFTSQRGILHSILFGNLAGASFGGGLVLYRAIYINYFDIEYVPLQSRERYMEKQQIYQEELLCKLNHSILASLLKNYNPIHLRLPFESIPENAK